MKAFKFLTEVTPTSPRNRRRRFEQDREHYNSFSYPSSGDNMFNGDMNFIFVWSQNDIRTNDYRLGIYQGSIRNFPHTYDSQQIADDEMLYLIPTIQAVHIISLSENMTEGTSYYFDNPDEMVVIFYKVYTNESV